MRNEITPKSVSDFLAIVPVNPEIKSPVICKDSKTGEGFFRDFEGAEVTDISLLRYNGFDVVVFITNDGRAIAVVAQPGAFIALEKDKGQNKKAKDVNLAFRGDISHKRLDLMTSMVAGKDVTYQDASMVKGETVGIDPSADFVQVALAKGMRLKNVKPTWYTEDWFSLTAPDWQSLVLRADRNSILGAATISPRGINLLQIGDDPAIQSLKLSEPPQGVIPSKVLPGNE